MRLAKICCCTQQSSADWCQANCYDLRATLPHAAPTCSGVLGPAQCLLVDLIGWMTTSTAPQDTPCRVASSMVGFSDERLSGSHVAMQGQARQIFFARVRKNFHVVLDASPQCNFFLQQYTQYPGIVNHCAILWSQDWAPAALHAVGARMLSQVETQSLALDQALADLSVDIHKSAAAIATKYQQATRRQ